ncbi:MAG TPA: cupin domain-containing protein [Candidatus Limnocylindria bacterium]|nr:cupin domain-containing protein [Candidatus Limnocylindria bacterium]
MRQNHRVHVMRVAKNGRVRSPNPIFKGEVDYQTIVGDTVSHQVTMSEVTFKQGAANKWHVHSCDQILVITEGEGTVADDQTERAVTAGDVAFIPANTKHWHGARPGKDMTHLSILAGGRTTIVE